MERRGEEGEHRRRVEEGERKERRGEEGEPTTIRALPRH